MDFQKTFDTPFGKRVLENLSKVCGEESPSYIDQNPYGTAYAEGKRAIILYIKKKLKKSVVEERQQTAK